MKPMKLVTYRTKTYDYDNNPMYDDIELPDDIKWFKDSTVDGMLCRGCRNYTAFIKMSDYSKEIIDKLDESVYMVKMGEYALLYINNKVFDGRHPKYTKELQVPDINILSWEDSSYKFASVIKPLEYIGGGDFKCLCYYRNYLSFDWDVSIEMSSIYLATVYGRYTRRNYNGKFVQEYANAVKDMLFNGKTDVDWDILSRMFKDDNMDATVFDRIMKGNEIHYTDGRVSIFEEVKG